MKIPKIKPKKIKDFLIKLPRILGTRAFLTFLGLLFFAFVVGGIIFEKYSISAGREMPEVSDELLQFKEKTYQEILKVWQEKEKKLQEADSKKYPDLFRGIKGEVSKSEPEPEEVPELPAEKDRELQEATNLEEFYIIKGEKLPPVKERAKLWEEKGLGPFEEYIGSRYQNLKLLEELKKELTE